MSNIMYLVQRPAVTWIYLYWFPSYILWHDMLCMLTSKEPVQNYHGGEYITFLIVGAAVRVDVVLRGGHQKYVNLRMGA